MEVQRVEIRTPGIGLAALLKFAGAVGTGGEAKRLVQDGAVRVNGAIETHRGRTLAPGDRVEVLDADGDVAIALEVAAAADAP
jgi:ribosome-associated protein